MRSAFRMETAGVADEPDAAFTHRRPQPQEHRNHVARVAKSRVALTVLLKNRERQFRQVVTADVPDTAALDAREHRLPRVAVETQPRPDANRLDRKSVV